MAASDQTVREVLRVIRKHVDQATLKKIMDELLDVQPTASRGRFGGDALDNGDVRGRFIVDAVRSLSLGLSPVHPRTVVKQVSSGLIAARLPKVRAAVCAAGATL